MKKIITITLLLLTVSIFAQEWYGNRELLENIAELSSKDSTWEDYLGAPYYAPIIQEERAVYYNVNDFGFEYPISLHAVTSYLYSDGYTFGFKIYDKDGTTILYEKGRLTSIVDFNDHYLTSPIVLNDNFWVAVVPDAEGYPAQVTSSAVENTHSYLGGAGTWETYITDDGDKHEHITSILISQYEGVDTYIPYVRNVFGTEAFSNLNANVGLLLQDQNSVVSPLIGEYSFDSGTTWTPFNLEMTKSTMLFTGSVPGQADGTLGIIRFNLEDDQGNTGLSGEYPISWSNDFLIFKTSFETDPFNTEGWSLETVGAGWQYLYTSGVYPTPHTGDYHMGHLDDSGTQDDWFVSPVISLPSETNILLSFWETSRWVEFIGSHEVSVTTDGGTTWTQISSTVPEENVYNQVFASLDDFAGQNIQIGWHYVGDYNDQWFFDDVEIFVNADSPTLNRIYATESIFPILGGFINYDMDIYLDIYDKTYIETAVGHYSFDGGATYTDIDLTQSKGDESWLCIIPAKDSAAVGSIYFDITNPSGNTLTTSNYTIEFVTDDWNPLIEKVLGNIVQINNDANISLLLSDHSGISSCVGYFSKDGFVTETEITFTSSKINIYQFLGTVPAETELTTGEIKFVIEDNGGNIINSDAYPVEWINTLPVTFDLRTAYGSNMVTPVKEQVTGTCWCMAVCSAAEGNMKMSGIWDAVGEIGEPNLSEKHLDWWNGFNDFYNQDIYPEDGEGLETHNRGDYLVTSAYMSRGEGFVREIDAPDFAQPERFSDTYHYFYAKDIEWHSMDAQLNGIDLIKQQIIENGVIGTSLCYSYDFLSAYDYFHYQ
ncbi:MAG: hypothetical protein GQ534_02210, partial [Candidatus Delongbacteria bacterium]|nr:hypothetical protein [Candidatus Delongbacteria bacterium]